MNGLGLKQQAIYRFIQDSLYDRGLPPTTREIAEALRIPSTGNVQYHLGQLEKKGYIVREGLMEGLGGGRLRARGWGEDVPAFPLLSSKFARTRATHSRSKAGQVLFLITKPFQEPGRRGPHAAYASSKRGWR